MKNDRDRQLGAALLRLDTPAHRDGFFADVAAGIDAELIRTGAARAKHRRFWRPSRSAPSGRRRPHLALAGAIAAAIVTAALLVGLPAVQKVIERPFGGSAAEGSVFPGPEPARAQTAAQVVRIVEQALRTARTITADYGQWIGRPGDKPSFVYDIHVLFAADGSRWVTANHKNNCWELTYDADTGVKRVWFGEFGPAPSVRIVTEEYSGMPPGEPDGGDSRALFDHPTPGGMGWELYGAIAHVARSDPDGKVGTGKFDGRPVWIVTCPVMPHAPEATTSSAPSGASDPRLYKLTVSVDQQSGLPVRVQAWIEGRLRAEGRLVHVRVNETVPTDTFTSERPASAEVRLTDNGRLSLRVDVGTKTTRMRLPYDPAEVSADDVRVSIAGKPRVADDMGFRNVAIDQVGPATGRVTLAPAWTPPGFDLQIVAVKDRQRPPGLSGDPTRQKTRAGTGIVVLHYEAGFQEITVTTRRLDPSVSKPAAIRLDPFIGDRWPGWTYARTPVRVSGGAFAGAKGAVVIAPLTIPHLWAVKDGVLLTVAGNCSAEDLLAIADSMEPWQAGAEPPLPTLDVTGE
jgi:hypothetical protein